MQAEKTTEAIVKVLTDLEVTHAIARLVYDAILAERERCAQIAESFIPSGFRDEKKGGYNNIGIARDDRARTIAYAIRNQKDA